VHREIKQNPETASVGRFAKRTFISAVVCQPRIVEHDFRDRVGLQSESLEKPPPHHHCALRIAFSQQTCWLGFRVRCNPGRKQHTPQHHKDRKYRLILFRHRHHGLISLKPCVLQIGYDRFVLHEAHGRGEIVEKPGETAVIEIDDAEPFSVDEKICKPQIGMNKAESMMPSAIDTEALRESIGDRLQELPA
jgi:hypothetical protein